MTVTPNGVASVAPVSARLSRRIVPCTIPSSDQSPHLDNGQRLSPKMATLLNVTYDRTRPLHDRVASLAALTSEIDAYFTHRDHQATTNRTIVSQLLSQSTAYWHNELVPQLQQAGLCIVPYVELRPKQHGMLRRYFTREILPLLTPFAVDAAHPFPYVSHLSINLAIDVLDSKHRHYFARVKVPEVLPRLLPVSPCSARVYAAQPEQERCLVWVEEVIAANLDLVFPALTVATSVPFRVTRIANGLATGNPWQRYGTVTRLEVDRHIPGQLQQVLKSLLDVSAEQIYQVSAPLGLSDLPNFAFYDTDVPGHPTHATTAGSTPRLAQTDQTVHLPPGGS